MPRSPLPYLGTSRRWIFKIPNIPEHFALLLETMPYFVYAEWTIKNGVTKGYLQFKHPRNPFQSFPECIVSFKQTGVEYFNPATYTKPQFSVGKKPIIPPWFMKRHLSTLPHVCHKDAQSPPKPMQTPNSPRRNEISPSKEPNPCQNEVSTIENETTLDH